MVMLCAAQVPYKEGEGSLGPGEEAGSCLWPEEQVWGSQLLACVISQVPVPELAGAVCRIFSV